MKITELILREEWTPTPEQVKWLGNADRKDPYILARMPGEKPPLSYFKDPDDQAKAKELNVGTNNLNTVKSVVGGKPDEPIFSTSPNSNFGTFRGFSGTNQAGKDPGPGDGAAPYKFEPYAEPNSDGELGNRPPPSSGAANQSGNSSTGQSGSSSTTSPNQSGGSSNSSIDPSYGNDRKMKDADSLTGGAAAGAAAAGNSRGKTGDPEKDIGPPAELTTALTQLNNILKKYKVTTESRNNLKRRMISENLHEFSPAEQIRIFTILIENKPEQLNEFIAPLVRGLGRLFRGGSPGARNRAAQAARRAAITAQSTARRTAAAAARNPMRSIGRGLANVGKAGGVGLGLWGAYEGGKALWDWWNNKEEKPELEPLAGDPAGEVPGAGGPAGEGPGAGGTEGQAGTVGQAVAAGFISKEDVDIIKKQMPILVRYFGLDTTSNDLKLDIKTTIDGIEDLREKAMSGQLPALAGAAGQAGKTPVSPKPWGKTGDAELDIGPLPKSVITKDGKTRERPPGFVDSMWKAYLKYLKDKGHLNDTGVMK